jgi:hypothetical protein
MKNIKLIVAFMFMSYASYGQKMKKDTVSFYSNIQKLDTNEMKQGKQIELAKYLSIEKFITYYLEYGKTENTKKFGLISINEYFNDANYVYFVRRTANYILDFIKVDKSYMKNIKLENLDGKLVREKFIDQVVPQTDKDRVKRKERQCTSQYINPQFTYNFNKLTNEVEIIYKWKISCDFIYKIINKTYTANYNINDAKFNK